MTANPGAGTALVDYFGGAELAAGRAWKLDAALRRRPEPSSPASGTKAETAIPYPWGSAVTGGSHRPATATR